MELVESSVERLVEHSLEQHSLCRGRFALAKTNVRGKDASITSFYHAEVLCSLPLVNCPG